MILLRAAGCGWEPDAATTARLAATAVAFVACGGAVTLSEWALLTEPERQALARAVSRAREAAIPETEEDRARRLLLQAVDREADRIARQYDANTAALSRAGDAP